MDRYTPVHIGGFITTCLEVIYLDIPPADALLDLDGGRLVLSPHLSYVERLAASRRLLRDEGVDQPYPFVVTCVCGDDLDVGPRAPEGDATVYYLRTAVP